MGYKSISSENMLVCKLELTEMNARRALTGQSCEPVVPKYTITLCLYGSVLNALMAIVESIAISE